VLLASAVPPKVGVLLLVVSPLVGLVIVGAAGAVASTAQVRLAGVASVLPAASVALTWKVCEPSLRLV
jgi:hypothetical protein